MTITVTRAVAMLPSAAAAAASVAAANVGSGNASGDNGMDDTGRKAKSLLSWPIFRQRVTCDV